MAGGGGCTAGEGAGSGYGSAHAAGSRVHRTPCPAHHQGAQRVAEQGLNNAGRVLAAGTALLAAAVAVAAVTLAGPRTKPGVYVDLARAGVGWSDILPGTARQAGRSARGATTDPASVRLRQSARRDMLDGPLTPEGVLNPDPYWKYNLFAPDTEPIPPHHKWSRERLREEAERLVLLTEEAQDWENQRYPREVLHLHHADTFMDSELSNVSKIEAMASERMAVLEKPLEQAEKHIDKAEQVTHEMQGTEDHDLDKTRRAVWEIIMTHNKQIDLQALVQGYVDRQAQKDMQADGKMDYLRINRYDKAVRDKKEEIEQLLRVLRGRIGVNLTKVESDNAKVEDKYATYSADVDSRMLNAYFQATQLEKVLGKDVVKAANLRIRNRLTEGMVHETSESMYNASTVAKHIKLGTEALDNLMENQHIQDDHYEVLLLEKYESLKSRLSMLVTALTRVQGAMKIEQEAHIALKKKEETEMTRLRNAVEDLKPKLQSILDLDGVLQNVSHESHTNIGAALKHYSDIQSAQDKVNADDTQLKDEMALVTSSVTEDEKFVKGSGYMSSYADIQSMLNPVEGQIDEIKSMHDTVNKTSEDLSTWSNHLLREAGLMQEEHTKWKEQSGQTAAILKTRVENATAAESSSIEAMFTAIKSVRGRIEEAKSFKESSLALHVHLRAELARTTQELKDVDTKFSEMYDSIRERIDQLGKDTEGAASPDEMRVAAERINESLQQTMANVQNVPSQVEYLRNQEASERSRLAKTQETLESLQVEIDNTLRRANDMLQRHPSLLQRISCVCYDGDKLNGHCVAGSLDDSSTCDPCPAGSFCLRGVEYPCKTTCWSGQVLTGACGPGSVSDVSTCVPSPEGFYAKRGRAHPCKTTCDPGFELRGTCPVGSQEDTTRCHSCPAGFFCEDGIAHTCKTSCDPGLVLTGKCRDGSATDTTSCETSPAGFYSENGVAIPCKRTCEPGKYVAEECPAGSKSDTSLCTDCPEGFYCTGEYTIISPFASDVGVARKLQCKTSCQKGEQLTGSCSEGSASDVTLCMRCPEGNFCEDGKVIPCKTTCEPGKYLEGRCRKGSTEDTTKCRTCKSNFFCSNGTATPCKTVMDCDEGYTLEGSCERGSFSDTTVCSMCPEGSYCEKSAFGYVTVTECRKRCWEGKILEGKCLAGSSRDTTTCDKCPEGSYCKKGVAHECNKQCDDGFVFSGTCPVGSVDDTTECNPCPAGSFCKDGNVESCKNTCADGLLLQGFCRAGSKSDKTRCVDCPQGSFCVDGKAQECVSSCPNGQMLTGKCEGSSFTHCEPCPAGSFCRNDEVRQCKETCPAGQYLQGECEEGSSRDRIQCLQCPEGSFCVDGKVHTCRETCPAGQQLVGECPVGSSADSTSCIPCPAGVFCVDGQPFPCATASSCGLGKQFVGECSAGSEIDRTSCDPCPPGSYCRNGIAQPCRTNIDCNDGFKIAGTCKEGSDMNPVCKPCRAGVFCVGGEESSCKVTCDPGMVLEGFCSSGSPKDTTTCTAVQAGSFAVDGIPTSCKNTCEDGLMLVGSCPEGGSTDGMTCVECPEGSWCKDGIAQPCKTECPNGKILGGGTGSVCPAGSKEDVLVCDPCPEGSFCADGKVTPCKVACPDGKFLEGECSAGSAEDTTHCTPCPSGLFCKDGSQTPCTSTCPDGQLLDGFCSAGSTEDTVTCKPCPSGSYCTGGVATTCRTTCDDGEEFKGTCETGATADTTSCGPCPEGFFCQDGLKAPCKISCPFETELRGRCAPGSVTDSVICFSDATPKPFFINWWNEKLFSENVNQQHEGRKSADLGDEVRLTSEAGTSGFIEGRLQTPLPGAKWRLQFYAFWPGYDEDSEHANGHTYPTQAYGKQADDTILATINGQVFPMDVPSRHNKPSKPGTAYFTTDLAADEIVWRFDFASKTPEPKARPFIVAGEVTILRDSTTGDEGTGAGTGKGQIRGYVLNALDGKKIYATRASNDGYDRKGIPPSGSEAQLLLFKKSVLITQVPVQNAKVKFKIEDGEYTCVALMKGFMTFYDSECTVAAGKLKKDIIFSPFVAPGAIRAVLTWGSFVKDMDCYMLVPHEQITDPPCEANWKNKKCQSGSVHLDMDNAAGFGPETITAGSLRSGRYRYRVSEYQGYDDNRDRLKNSEAQVWLYTATGVTIFRASKAGSESEPTGAGFLKGESWYVFTIDGATGKVYPCETQTCGHGFHDRNNRGRAIRIGQLKS